MMMALLPSLGSFFFWMQFQLPKKQIFLLCLWNITVSLFPHLPQANGRSIVAVPPWLLKRFVAMHLNFAFLLPCNDCALLQLAVQICNGIFMNAIKKWTFKSGSFAICWSVPKSSKFSNCFNSNSAGSASNKSKCRCKNGLNLTRKIFSLVPNISK